MTPPRTPAAAKAAAKRAPRKAPTPVVPTPPTLEVELLHRRMRRQPWRFKVRSLGNHETIVWSEAYANRQDRDAAVELLRTGMASAVVRETEEGSA